MGFLRKIFRKYFWLPFLCLFFNQKLSKFKALNAIETLEYVIKNKCSLARFGDGDIDILTKTRGTGYQTASEPLRIAMEKVLTSKQKNLLICIPAVLVNFSDLSIYTDRAKYHFRNILVRFYKYLGKVLRTDVVYGDTQVSRPYMDTLNQSYSENIFKGFKELFSVRTLIVIEGEKTRLGVGNDLLSGAQNVLRVLAPAVNAFDRYDEIFQKALEVAWNQEKKGDKPEDILFVLALGSTAKLLTYDLTAKGYRAVDVGHLDIEYEWFLRGAQEKIAISGKYVNEAKDGEVWLENSDLNLEQYEKEIVARVGI